LEITIRIEEVVPPIDLNDERLTNVLTSKAFIAGGREFDLPCQFEPWGWKDSGGLISTFANVPGNTLPIIWASGGLRNWTPLKDRFFNPFDAGQMEALPRCLADGGAGACPLDRNNLLAERISKPPETEILDLSQCSALKGEKELQNQKFDVFRRKVYARLACQCPEAPQSVSQNGQSWPPSGAR
jgi:hypothetical protein